MVQTKKVLWISRHLLSQEQRADLERALCAPVQVVPWTDTVRDMEDLRPALDQADAVPRSCPWRSWPSCCAWAGPKPVLQARGERVPTAGGGLRRGEGRNRSSLSSTGAGSRSWTSRSRLGPCDPASQKEPPVP